MYPLTQDQECTLRYWVSMFGKPGSSEKSFLRTKKGLTEDQINFWLNTHHDVQPAGYQLANQPNSGSFHLPRQPPGHSFDVNTAKGDPAHIDNSPVERFDNDSLSLLLPPSQDDTWSPIISTEDGFFDVGLMEALEQTHPWATVDCSQGGSMFPAVRDSQPLLSEPFNSHWTYMSGSDRSSCVSYESSTRIWETASTLCSFTDLYAEDQTEQKFEMKHEQPRTSTRRSKSGTSSRFLGPGTIQEEDCSRPCPNHELTLKPSSTQKISSRSDDDRNLSGPKVPPKTDKPQGKYVCTVCKLPFSRKGDWERHEDSQHEPQIFWTCMLNGEPAIQTLGRWSCAFCDICKPNRDEIFEHALKDHKIRSCTNKPIANRTFTRKDKLKAHLQQVHSLSEHSTHWENWQTPATTKGAWGCGFCGACRFKWEERLFHIAEHYEQLQPPHISQWSESLVVKGLLKQCKPNFNTAGPWNELVSSVPGSDRLVKWSKKDAAILKRKLEFHKGNPRELATEAWRLAGYSCVTTEQSTWTASDSDGTALMKPLPSRGWVDNSALGIQLSPFPASTEQADFEMSNYI